MGFFGSIVDFSYNLTHTKWFYIVSGLVITILLVINIYLKRKSSRNEMYLLLPNPVLENFVRKAIKEEHLESNIKKVLLEKRWPERQIDLMIKKVREEERPRLFGFLQFPKIRTREERLADKISRMVSEQEKNHSRINKKEIDYAYDEAMDIEESEEEFVRTKGAKSSGSGGIIGVDVIRTLLMADKLLEKLPEEEIEKFMRTPDAELFKEVMQEAKKHRLPGKITGKTTLADLMKLVDNGIITKEEARSLAGMSHSTAKKKLQEKLDKAGKIVSIKSESQKTELEKSDKLSDAEKRQLLEKEIKALETKMKEVEDEEQMLSKKEAEVRQEEEKLKTMQDSARQEIVHHENITGEMKDTLLIVDKLLVKLPHEDIIAFAKSSDYSRYAEVMKKVLDKEAVKPLSAPKPPADIKTRVEAGSEAKSESRNESKPEKQEAKTEKKPETHEQSSGAPKHGFVAKQEAKQEKTETKAETRPEKTEKYKDPAKEEMSRIKAAIKSKLRQ